MKNKTFSMLVFSLILITCKNANNKNQLLEQSECQKIDSILKDNFTKGNYIFLMTKINYDDRVLYEMFKKYNIIDYKMFYPEVETPCFQEKNNLYLKEVGLNYDAIVLEMDSLNKVMVLNKQKDFLEGKISKKVFFDYEYLDGNKAEGPNIKSPYLRKTKDFNDKLKSKLKTNILDTLKNKFWITIDSHGFVKDISPYVKVSKLQDSILSQELKQAEWYPGFDKSDNKFVAVRFLW